MYIWKSCKHSNDCRHLSPAVSISDIISEASICGKSGKYVTNQSFSALHEWRVSQHDCILGSSNMMQEKTLLSYEHRTTKCRWKYLHIFYFFQASLHVQFGSCLIVWLLDLQASCIAADYKLTLGVLAADSPDYEKIKSQVRRNYPVLLLSFQEIWKLVDYL